MFFKAVFALYFAIVALAIPLEDNNPSKQGTSCENP
jgi:hypothetical protein